jgi:hypothetical protein
MYQSPETYVRQFLEQVFGDAYVYREVRTPYLKLVADYATENVVIETEPPCGRDRGREQLFSYLKEYKRNLGILIDIPVERYYREYPNPCLKRVGFEIYRKINDKIELIYKNEYSKEEISRASYELRNIFNLLKRFSVGSQEPTANLVISDARELVEKHKEKFMELVGKGKVSFYYGIWEKTMYLIYGKETLEGLGNNPNEAKRELFIELSIYMTWIKALGATLLEATLGRGKANIPIELYIYGGDAAVRLFWERGALQRFNISYLFDRDEYDWVFSPEIAPTLDAFFKDLGERLSRYDWARAPGTDLLKRLYQHVVSRELRRQLGEYYTPDWIARLILWRVLHLLVHGKMPDKILPACSEEGCDVEAMIDKEIVDLLDEYYERYKTIPRFIDPTCGSFTFGVQYINALLKWYEERIPKKHQEKHQVEFLHPVKFAEKILSDVVGIDVNPVAVTTAKVNYLLQIYRLLAISGMYLSYQPILPILRLDLLLLHLGALPTRRELTLEAFFAKKTGMMLRIFIPLALLGISRGELPKEIPTTQCSAGGDNEVLECIEFKIPNKILEITEDATRFARALVALFAEGVEEFENEIGGHLAEDLRKVLETVRSSIKALEERGLNGIWYSMVINYLLALYVVHKKFDLVLGNLPWVNISKYPSDYRELVKYVAQSLEVWPPGPAAKKMDISIPLFAIALKHLANNRGVVALMVPTSIFRGVHGTKWRELLTGPKYRLVEIWDLEEVKPFEGAQNQPGIAFIKLGEG